MAAATSTVLTVWSARLCEVAGQGRAGQGRAGQGRAGQGTVYEEEDVGRSDVGVAKGGGGEGAAREPAWSWCESAVSHLGFGHTSLVGGPPSESGRLTHQQLPHIILQKAQHAGCEAAMVNTMGVDHLLQIMPSSYVGDESLAVLGFSAACCKTECKSA